MAIRKKKTARKTAKPTASGGRKAAPRKTARRTKPPARKAKAPRPAGPATKGSPAVMTNNGPHAKAPKAPRLVVVPEPQIIPARQGKAAFVKKGMIVKVVNDRGMQVLDNWAISYPDINEYMTMEHTRFEINRLRVKKGDSTWTNRRRKMFTMVEDTSWGWHDTQVASCDIFLYKNLGVKGYHRSCTDNFWQACKDIGIKPVHMPGPFNLFQHTLVQKDESYEYPIPKAKPGCHVSLRAEQDMIIIFSACPFDLPQFPVNGPGGQINDCHFVIS